MELTSFTFKKNVKKKLSDARLQNNMRRFGGRFVEARAKVMQEVDNLEEIRVAAAAIRDRSLDNLDTYLTLFEEQATQRGTVVHYAETAHDVNRIVLEIAKANQVKKIVKSKSMVSEESGLNDAVIAAGIEAIETDLGEYILQLAKEPPSHIIAPAIHKSVEEVAELFSEHHHTPKSTDIPALCREAREQLRPHFLSADMGISGGNFLIAETGSVAIVTNEGNGRMVTTMPRIHVAITGIEKVLGTLNDFSTILRLLTRSATGQSITNYVSVMTGIRDADNADGPEQSHIILVDSGRSRLLAGRLKQALRCIRCGACMNHCPVYQNIGGHAYGWVYPGPIGAVLTPSYVGLKEALDLPQASTLCGACQVVCPVKIPLPELMRVLREDSFSQGLRPWHERLSVTIWRYTANHPKLYGFMTRHVVKLLKVLGGRKGLIHRLPGLDGWTEGRDMPAPTGKTFRDQYKAQQDERKR
ncbi:MAG: iron-sulfur cluster-binding protein [Betaproteobacteria bacterium]|nr:iron-sulfur cluster-binding protein [Betaproteobacteria bacterium]MDE2055888.1 iron-sulfur cluster-binding protein [Betaproteobacteria bacterium]